MATSSKAFVVGNQPFPTTLARQVAKKDLRTLNHLFWVGEKSYKFIRKSYEEIASSTSMTGQYGTSRIPSFFPEAV